MISEDNNHEDEEQYTLKEFNGRNGSTMRVVEYRGEYLSPSVVEIQNHTIRDDDVYLATYPKSGSIWLYNIINMLLHGDVSYSTSFNFIGYANVTEIDNMTSPRLIGTHFLYPWLPEAVRNDKNVKIINLVRNPKDTCVSCYHYSKKRSYYQGNWDDFLEMFSNGDVWGGSWFKYFKSWERIRRENPRIMLMKYEDIKTDFRSQLVRLASFLGVSYDQNFYDSLEKKCRFEVMMKDTSIVRNAINIEFEETNTYFRKGKIGDWKYHFTVAQNETFDAVYENEMKDCQEKFRFH